MTHLTTLRNSRQTVRWSLLYPILAVLLAAMILPTTGLQAQNEPDKPDAEQPEKTLTETLGGTCQEGDRPVAVNVHTGPFQVRLARAMLPSPALFSRVMTSMITS